MTQSDTQERPTVANNNASGQRNSTNSKPEDGQNATGSQLPNPHGGESQQAGKSQSEVTEETDNGHAPAAPSVSAPASEPKKKDLWTTLNSCINFLVAIVNLSAAILTIYVCYVQIPQIAQDSDASRKSLENLGKIRELSANADQLTAVVRKLAEATDKSNRIADEASGRLLAASVWHAQISRDFPTLKDRFFHLLETIEQDSDGESPAAAQLAWRYSLRLRSIDSIAKSMMYPTAASTSDGHIRLLSSVDDAPRFPLGRPVPHLKRYDDYLHKVLAYLDAVAESPDAPCEVPEFDLDGIRDTALQISHWKDFGENTRPEQFLFVAEGQNRKPVTHVEIDGDLKYITAMATDLKRFAEAVGDNKQAWSDLWHRKDPRLLSR